MTARSAPIRTNGASEETRWLPSVAEIADRLDKIGLSLPVRAHERGNAPVERNLDPGVRAEVGQRQMRDVHELCADLPLLPYFVLFSTA